MTNQGWPVGGRNFCKALIAGTADFSAPLRFGQDANSKNGVYSHSSQQMA
jgi:hypothetical protein